MTDFLLIPGAGGHPASWDLLPPELAALGHRGIAVDLPQNDEAYGWAELAGATLSAYDSGRSHDDGAAQPCVVVTLSMGAYVGPLVAGRLGAKHLVLLNPMVPLVGESAEQWWDAVGHEEARTAAGLGDFDEVGNFFNGVPDDVRDRLLARDQRGPSARSFAQPWPGPWPSDVPITVLAAADDRFFPLALQRQVARERLGLGVTVLPGGHLNPLSHAGEVARALVAAADAAPS